MNINHLAVIPDGNRRWAKKNGFPSFIGHQRGAENFEELVFKALEMKIKYFTFWGTSLDNILKRSESEINYLYDIFEKQFNRLSEDKRVHENKVKVTILGEWENYFPEKIKKSMHKAIENTKEYSDYNLIFMMAYNGDNEMLDCVRKIVASGNKDITMETIKENLWTKDFPPVDLVIRTGCEDDPHLSAGFMMWDTAYSQLFFTEDYFPEFVPENLEKAINQFTSRERRNGK
ncbi:MAG: polyprenyl diphosphate synthase [Candidatus Pacebacteria bacterium]|nr:polyprenyl diphosphate synthase [Candidatus Paceibacterota bacterium]